MGGWCPTYMTDINSIEDLIGKEDLFEGKVYGIDEGAGITKRPARSLKVMN